MSKQKNLNNISQNINRESKIFFLKAYYSLKKWPWRKIFIEVLVYSLLFFIAYTAFVNFYYARKLEDKISNAYDIDKLPAKEYAIIFGAGLKQDKTASTILADRVQVGLNLFQAGKVKKLLLSGNNGLDNYNEPKAMLDYIETKVGKEKLNIYTSDGTITADDSGKSTYDTCYRAKNKFDVNDAYLVTQDFHIVRTMMTCRLLGIESVGIKSDLHEYSGALWFRIRDIFATDKAVVDLKIFKPKVELQ